MSPQSWHVGRYSVCPRPEQSGHCSNFIFCSDVVLVATEILPRFEVAHRLGVMAASAACELLFGTPHVAIGNAVNDPVVHRTARVYPVVGLSGLARAGLPDFREANAESRAFSGETPRHQRQSDRRGATPICRLVLSHRCDTPRHGGSGARAAHADF